MGKKNFDRKKAVRFSLVPGPVVDGKPTVLYKPVQTKKSKVSKKQRKEVVSKFADIEEITINGKVVDQNQIPAYVLEQIRGRGDLIYNQMKGMPKEEEEGDMYQIQDAKQGDSQYEQYEIDEQDFEQKPIIQEQQHDYSQGQDQWQDDEEGDWSEQGQIEQVEIQHEKAGYKQEKYETKVEQFPTIQQTKVVNIEGKDYQLTTKQIEMLEIVIPQNYEEMDFGGLQFKKYNEDGLPLSEKQKYQKYLLGQNQKVVVIDTYQYVPPRPIDTFDTDLTPAQINKDVNLKEIQQALNYNGDEEIYQEMEDDFFAKMIQMQLGQTQQNNKPKQSIEKQLSKQKIISKPKEKKDTKKQINKDLPVITQKELDQQLKKAVFNFQHNIEEKKEKRVEESSEQDEQEDILSHNNHSMNFTDLQKRQEYKGNDGELDWRCLTKKQKKQYMKTKVIQDFYDQLRNRQIQQKLEGKNNIKVEQLHLKQLVKHIPYEEDLVMQKALEEDLKKQVHLSEEDQDAYESLSEEDDIISFHQKTSIIASNLSIIEQPRTKTKKPKKEVQGQPQNHNLTITKVVPEKRDKNQTVEQRKARKQKLKEMKKQRKQQKKEFAQKFSKIKRETHKSTNTTNPLNKVSYVKIY